MFGSKSGKYVKKIAAGLLILCMYFCTEAKAEEPGTGNITVNAVPKSRALKVLMVGNSLTNCQNNYTIRDLKALAKKTGWKLTVRELSYNNAKLKDWADAKSKNGKKLRSEIRSRKWDYIILQEHTEAAVKKSFPDASKKISAYIRSESPKTQIIYNCTWAYKKGKKIDGKNYSSSALQKKMDQNYRAAAQQTGGRVCWSGDAFLKYRKSNGIKRIFITGIIIMRRNMGGI